MNNCCICDSNRLKKINHQLYPIVECLFCKHKFLNINIQQFQKTYHKINKQHDLATIENCFCPYLFVMRASISHTTVIIDLAKSFSPNIVFMHQFSHESADILCKKTNLNFNFDDTNNKITIYT